MTFEMRHPDRKAVVDILDQPECRIMEYHENDNHNHDNNNNTNNTNHSSTQYHFHAPEGRIPITTTWDIFGKYRYGVSPFGYGLDCYRTWEMLWMGMIPIVRSSSLDSLYRRLPVIIVQDYNDLCRRYDDGSSYLDRAFAKIRPYWPAPDRIFQHRYWIHERYDGDEHEYWSDLSNRFDLAPTIQTC
eukprot:CAMPEP_0202451842 /NCGR_PEP_ID=MMETSP1360-20130828/10182_1 /ASSEMBLY_ACC=CAM_ASM_000848 /TAXON_ID=515479 /ORGANISM="Licmophora paradoxa, Strain CCMP2313" /LENGTH=186 /DNA_ID=CAMNT_0049070505 /DNA_START=358 /DNA_END=918 /DNA_ORIENTATION=+